MSNNRETTLTTPEDRKTTPTLDTTVPPLTDREISFAVQELNNTSFTERFPKAERRYADPPLDLQKIGLISFVPAKGATPNDKGVYGFAKLRGNFASEAEANTHAENLIRNVDSYHQIYHTYVGRPFPITSSSDFSKEVSTVELQRQVAESYGEDVKKKREKEQKDIEEIQNREKALLEDVKKEEEPTDDRYTTLRVKKAQLIWTYSETSKKLKQMVNLIAKARYEIEQLEIANPDLKTNYYNKYVEARKAANLPVDKDTVSQSFMKYLVEDLHIPEVDEEYRNMYEVKE